jgi:cation-dependent mannose-6-phosphate receptor
MRFGSLVTFLVLGCLSIVSAEDTKTKPRRPCTIKSPTSGLDYDINGLAVLPKEEGKKANKNDREESWQARGYDYKVNYTINFCAPVVEELKDVVGVEETLWKNVSAFYRSEDKIYALG